MIVLCSLVVLNAHACVRSVAPCEMEAGSIVLGQRVVVGKVLANCTARVT